MLNERGLAILKKVVCCLWIGALMGETQTLSQDTLPRRIAFEHFAGDGAKANGRFRWSASEAVEWVSGFQGRAPRFAGEGAGILFSLESEEGKAKWLNLREGSLRFRFRPDWNSGEGTGRYASFCSIGVWTPPPPRIGYWALMMNPKGDQFVFSGQRIGDGETFLTAPVSFQSGRWHDLLLVYSPTETWLYVDGKAYGPGKGVTAVPEDSVCAQYGLWLGNNREGNQPIGGTMDTFEVYEGALSGFVQRKDACALEASVVSAPPSVDLRWNNDGRGTEEVRRRADGEERWTVLSSLILTNRYVDASPELKQGLCYEYSVGQRRLRIAIGPLPPAERRGRVLLLATQKIASQMGNALEQFKLDLVGDGWSVAQRMAPKHHSRWKARYQRRLAEVKSAIVEFHQQSPSERNVVLLIGNVPVPYSGLRAEDGHRQPGDDHRGAWPCDAYYGDVDGVWTDEIVSYTNRSHRSNTNQPGDGKFDLDYLPSSLEVAIGRIDFSNLPGIAGSSLPGRPRSFDKIEAALLQQYFDKNHAYRMGRFRYEKRAAAKSYLPSWSGRNIEINAFRNGCGLFGNRENAVCELDCFMMSSPTLLGFLAGYGGSDSIASGRHRTSLMNRPGYGPKSAFLMLYGSWGADWNLKDSFTKASLANASTGLATMSSLHGQWNLLALGLGKPLATCYLETANEIDRRGRVPRSLSILGDITLRLHVVPPVATLDARRQEGSIELSWTTDQLLQEELGCFIYRSPKLMGPYRRISGLSPVRGQEFIDGNASESEPYYMVRRAAVVRTPVGSYTNLSQGQFIFLQQ